MKHGFLEDVSLGKSTMFVFLFGGAWFIWWRSILCMYREQIDDLFPFGNGFNPPGVCLMISAVLMLGFLFGLFTLLQRTAVTKWIVDIMDILGKRTLYIFLYHRFFLDFILRRYVFIDNKLIKWCVYFGVMIGGSLILNIVRDKTYDLIRWVNKE